jgi:ketosteroid isomerase-like protein
MAKRKAVDAALARAMRDSLRAYANSDRRFFDYLRDDVRIYNLNSAEPMVGRAQFQKAFTDFRTKRKVAVLHSEVQPGDNQAILLQTLQVTVNGIASNVRQTVVWERGREGNWQMTHIHNALIGQPVVTAGAPTTARAVRVLNERIATVAAAVGVAQ